MTNPTAPPPAPDAPASPAPVRGSERFFLWIAGLGLARSEGWLGGVCAGIAARLRIDPLIVRGVLVVAALFGVPLIFLYAVAWALLPDADGHIHARDLLHRVFQPVQLGILFMAIVGLIPTTPIISWLFRLTYGGSYYYSSVDEAFFFGPWAIFSGFSLFVGIVVVGILLVLIVRSARRTPGASATAPSTASTARAAEDSAPDASALIDGSGAVDGALAGQDATESDAGALADTAAPASAPLLGPPAAPAPLPADAENPADIEIWRAQHAAWREQDQAWRRQQQDVERAAREQARRERQASAAVFAAEAAERRRIRRMSNPRASFAFVIAVIGLAVVIGAGVGLLHAGEDRLPVALGLLSAAFVLALGMVLAGALRRRSGFLAFLTLITVVGGGVAFGFAATRDVTIGSYTTTNNWPNPVTLRHTAGTLDLFLEPRETAPAPITVEQGQGMTFVTVQPGVELVLDASLGQDGYVTWQEIDGDRREVSSDTWTRPAGGDGEFRRTFAAAGTEPTTTQKLSIDQASGYIWIQIRQPEEAGQ